jgi:hypothetical protein
MTPDQLRLIIARCDQREAVLRNLEEESNRIHARLDEIKRIHDRLLAEIADDSAALKRLDQELR